MLFWKKKINKIGKFKIITLKKFHPLKKNCVFKKNQLYFLFTLFFYKIIFLVGMAIEGGEDKVNNFKYLNKKMYKKEKKLVKQKTLSKKWGKLLYLFNYHIPNISFAQPILATFHISFREMNEMKQVIWGEVDEERC